MRPSSWFSAAVIVAALASVACGARSSPEEADVSSSADGGVEGGVELISIEGPTGGGVCSTEDQQACDACIAKASKRCDTGLCKEQSIALEDCTAVSVNIPCADEMGNASVNCCLLEAESLRQCWSRCPHVRACM